MKSLLRWVAMAQSHLTPARWAWLSLLVVCLCAAPWASAQSKNNPPKASAAVQQQRAAKAGKSQHRAKAAFELGALDALAAVQGNRLAVFAYPHHVVTKVGLYPLLFEVQWNLGSANALGDPASRCAIQQRHPDLSELSSST